MREGQPDLKRWKSDMERVADLDPGTGRATIGQNSVQGRE